MGCGLLLAPEMELLATGVIHELPKPQRGLWARIRSEKTGELTAVSWHSPNAAGDGRSVKMEAYKTMMKWLSRAPRPLVLGADLNTWIDPVEVEEADPGDA